MTDELPLNEEQTRLANQFLCWLIAVLMGMGGTLGFMFVYAVTHNTAYRNVALIPLLLLIVSCVVELTLLGKIGAIQQKRREGE